MKMLKHFAAWLARNSRNIERRKLYREINAIGRERATHPERHPEHLATVCRHMARLQQLRLADVEARMKPVPLWPGLPTEGLRAAQEGGK
jgi:hypothetical protein